MLGMNVPNGQELPPGTLMLQIIVTPQGQCSVNGAIQNKMIAFGLLEVAKDAINEFHRRAQTSSGVEPVSGAMLRHLDGGKPKS